MNPPARPAPGPGRNSYATVTVPAHELRIGDLLLPDTGSPRRVVTARLEGPACTAVVAFAGIVGPARYPGSQPVTVRRIHGTSTT